MPDAARTGERIFRGIPVSPGVCRGKILVLGKPHGDVISHTQISDEEIPVELKRLEQALVVRMTSLADYAASDLLTERAALQRRLDHATATAELRCEAGRAASDLAL